MVGKIVIVFDWLQGSGFAVKAKMVDRDGLWEESLKGLGKRSIAIGMSCSAVDVILPSIMPRPERRIGTRTMRGLIVSVLYW